MLRLVIDVLKPHDPSMIEYAQTLEQIEGVEGVTATLVEIDEEVQNIKITMEGQGIEYEEVKQIIEDKGGSIHSVDEIATGERIVEEVHTPQD